VSGVQTHELRLKINAGAAESGSKKFKTAIESIKRAVAGLERSTDGAFKNLRQGMQASPGRGAETALKGTANAAKQAEQAAQRLSVSVKNSMVTASGQAQRLRDQFEAMGNVSGLKRVEAALAKLQARAKAAGSSTELGAAKADYRATVAGLQAEAKARSEAASAAVKQATASENLRKRHDEMFAVSKRYEASLAEIAQLERAGALTAEKAAAARARAAQQLQAGAVATGKYGQALKVSQFHVANFNNVIDDMGGRARRFDMRQVAMQLSQVGQQGSVTGNYLQALMVQLPDLALGLGPVGIAAGAVAGVLGTTLVGAMTKTSEESDKMKNKVHALSEALDSLEGNTQASAAQIEAHLKAAFGSVSNDVQALIEDLRAAEFSLISRKMQQEVEKATTELNRLGGAFEVYWANFLNPGSVESGYLKQTQELIMQSGVAYGEFQKLDAAVKAVFTAKDVNTFVANLSEARGIAEEIGGPVGTQIAEALLKAAQDGGVLNRVLGDASGSADTLATELSEGAIQVLKLNEIDMSDGLSDATKQAAELAANLNISLTAAYNLKNLQDSKTYSGRGGDPRQFENGYTPPSLATTTPRGGGGGSASVRDALTRTTNAMREQALAQTALRDGRYQSEEAARLWARAMLEGNGTLDAQTQAALANIDALALRNETLRSAPEDFAQDIASGVEGSLAGAIQSGLNGGNAVQNFAVSMRNHITNALAKSLATKITSGLGLDTLFNAGGVTAAAQMQAGIVAGSSQGAALMAQAIATGSAAGGAGGGVAGMLGGGGGGGFWSTAISVVGGLFGFDEGVANTSHPGAWQKLPHYAEGTANTSSGIPAVLHPNEAVVPLSRGRKIPVDMGEGSQGGVSVGDIVTNVTVEGDASTDSSIEMAQIVGETVDGRIRTILAEERAYGGTLNPRGGW